MNDGIASAAHAAGPTIEYTFKIWRMAFDNALTTAACAQELMTAKSPQEFTQRWTTRVQQQLDTMTAQGRAFGELAGRLATETGEPITVPNIFSKGLPTAAPSASPGATGNLALSSSDEVLLLHVME